MNCKYHYNGLTKSCFNFQNKTGVCKTKCEYYEENDAIKNQAKVLGKTIAKGKKDLRGPRGELSMLHLRESFEDRYF
jgi:hypothetical protein